MRCILIQPHLTREQEIVVGNLTYNAGKVWNAANYLLINGKAAFNLFDLYNKLKDSFFVRNIQSRSAQILMAQLIEGWMTFFDYLKHPDNYNFPIRRPKFQNKKRPHHQCTIKQASRCLEVRSGSPFLNTLEDTSRINTATTKSVNRYRH